MVHIPLRFFFHVAAAAAVLFCICECTRSIMCAVCCAHCHYSSALSKIEFLNRRVKSGGARPLLPSPSSSSLSRFCCKQNKIPGTPLYTVCIRLTKLCHPSVVRIRNQVKMVKAREKTKWNGLKHSIQYAYVCRDDRIMPASV